MQVSLFRALRSANIAEDTAEKVVHAFEEHIDMAVNEAMKHYDDRITNMQTILEAKLDTGLKNIEASIKGMTAGTDGKIAEVHGEITGVKGEIAGIHTAIRMLAWAVVAEGLLLAFAGGLATWIKIMH